MKYLIYKITFPGNKLYIGLTTVGLENRIQSHQKHFRDRKRQMYPVYNAIKKYGWENIDFEVLQGCTSIMELKKAEIKWIKELNTISPNGYNLHSGGNIPPKKITTSFSEKTKKQISKTLKKYYKKNGTDICKKAQKVGAKNRSKKTILKIEKAIKELLKIQDVIRTKDISKKVGIAENNVRPYLLKLGYFVGNTNNIKFIYEPKTTN